MHKVINGNFHVQYVTKYRIPLRFKRESLLKFRNIFGRVNGVPIFDLEYNIENGLTNAFEHRREPDGDSFFSNRTRKRK